MNKEFNLSIELKKIFEKELLGKVTNAGRIYRKLKTRDEEFIKREIDRRQRQIDILVDENSGESISRAEELEEELNKFKKDAGEELIEDYSKPSLTELRGL